jgi:small subunit ribosomal protein S8
LYYGYTEIPRVLNGLGISIVSTSKGLMKDADCRRNKAGGELLCNVW